MAMLPMAKVWPTYITALNAVKEGADLSLLINTQFDQAKTMSCYFGKF